MSYLIDTNIISELSRREANEGVVTWFAERPAITLYLEFGEFRLVPFADAHDPRRPVTVDAIKLT